MQMFNSHFTVYCYKLWAWINMYLIYRCLSSASAVIRSWFVYELHKSTTIAFSRNSWSLYTFYSWNSTCEIPPCLRISNRKYPPCPQNSIIVNPPPHPPPEILKALGGSRYGYFLESPNAISAADIAFIMSSSQAIVNWLNALHQSDFS